MGTRTDSSTAKLFMHGRSQAVRLPKEFRFSGTVLVAGNRREFERAPDLMVTDRGY